MDKPISDPHVFEHNPRILAKVFYNKAKLLWCVSLSCKCIGVMLGIVLLATNTISSLSPITVFVLAVISELSQWRSDVHKSYAESLTRKIEYHNGFGWPFAPKDMRDALTKVSLKTRDYIAKSIEQNYFASQLQASPQRAIANLRESAWWSNQLTGCVLWVCCITMGLLLAGSLLTLSYSISTITDLNTLGSTNKVVTAVLSLMVTLGLIKLIAGYTSFKLKSDDIEKSCNALLKSDAVSELDAVRLLHEYQISRASSPLIPDLVWKLKNKSLNELWDKYEATNPSLPQ